MTEETWSAVDFQLNKQFWKTWGPSAALPFRLRNLIDVQNLLWDNLGVGTSLYGTTLRHAINHRALKADHDDDLVCASDSIEKVKFWLRENCRSTGFSVIREEPGLISIERDGRYIDVRASPISLTGFVTSELHGLPFSFAQNFTDLLDDKYGVGRWATGDVASPTTNPKSRGAKASRGGHLLESLRFFWPAKPEGSRELRVLSEQEFLSLKIDAPDALNWDWRGSHLAPLMMPGQTFEDALEALSGTTETDLLRSLSEVDTSQPFTEPLNISRRFWKSGSNLFAYPFLYGFRHGVMPYSASNLYILAGLKPDLFTESYFESLPAMSEGEIKNFLRENPIEVVDGCITSGRHRATAMLGRIWHGRGYIPVWANHL